VYVAQCAQWLSAVSLVCLRVPTSLVLLWQRFFIFDERKQQFTFVIGIEASIIYYAYHSEPGAMAGRRPSGDHDGVKARVRVSLRLRLS
jgi:hypothetical protein